MQKLQIASVLAEQAKKMGKVLEHEQFDLLNVQLRAGEEIPAHSINNTSIIIVRKGDVVFNVEGEDVSLTAEDVLLFDPNEKHSLKAITEVDILIVKLK
ncbi:cupin domain-containing protein [Lysinibacillus endophyticus]|uniref:cupin domain-containing protein n=1 Tax=Ureibacillus endophyticus TaxID=1978490 RepID=UPI0020A12BE5|nr:cupin domain-containing protein [Lysinibacillus endophyticus]MCP1145784.1 cupin domain-containing protein [Lysinibacillus endophyticus]